ncbi:MAG: hypothetical protein VW985_09420 [Gammaproteobacteria bacterium]
MQIDMPRRNYQPAKPDPTPITPPGKVKPVSDRSQGRPPSAKTRPPDDRNPDEKTRDNQPPGFDEFA